jgi:hypothetical protein
MRLGAIAYRVCAGGPGEYAGKGAALGERNSVNERAAWPQVTASPRQRGPTRDKILCVVKRKAETAKAPIVR